MNQPNPLINLFPFIFIVLIFYFLIIRPQKAKQREHQRMVSELKKNDEVVTIGGIHGVIVNLKEKTIVLRVDDNTRIEVEKTAIAQLKSYV